MAVTVTFLTPVAGVTPPTALQALVNTVIATVAPTSSTDATAAITHNFGLAAADITSGFPLVSITPTDLIGAINNWFVLSQNPNFTLLGKNQSAGTDSVAQVQVAIQRPHSLIR